MRARLPVVPLVLTVVSAAAVVAGATAASGAAVPAPAAQQSGHWVVDGPAALHVHGGTAQVDARVDLPPEAAGNALTAVAAGSEGFVVGRDRVWTFDRSTLTVVSGAPAAAAEVPVPVEVVGGPYLVYREKGTVVRLGRPAVTVDAGGPLSAPVRTPDGTVGVYRRDTGEVCAMRRDALELDCSIRGRTAAPGGLTVTGTTMVLVDTAGDVAHRVLDDGLDGGTPLGADLPDDALLGDQAAGDRLPVVVPGANLLRLVDIGGLAGLRPGAAPVDVPLGEGAFSAPVVSGSAIALLELTAGRLLTFGPDGARLGETRLDPGTPAGELRRGEDGRIYLDEPGRTHVVRPDGSVATVELGDGRGPAVAAAPPPEQRAPVRPPPPGQVLVPAPGAPAVPVGAAPGGPVLAAPGLPGPGGVAVPGAQPQPGAPLPVVVPPPVDAPPAVEPPAGPPVEEVPEVPAPGVPGPPTGLTAQRINNSGSLLVELVWEAPVGGAAPAVGYQVTTTGDGASGTDTVAETEYGDNENYCAHEVSYEVRAVSASGATSAPAVVNADDPDTDCTPRSEVLSAVPRPDGTVVVEVECHTAPRSPFGFSELVLLVDGATDTTGNCRVHGSGIQDLHTFTVTGLAPGSTHTVQSRTSSTSGVKTSDPVTVTTAG
jgi:hypothetical protein